MRKQWKRFYPNFRRCRRTQRQGLESGRRSDGRGRQSWRKREEGRTGHMSCMFCNCLHSITTHKPLSQHFPPHSTTINTPLLHNTTCILSCTHHMTTVLHNLLHICLIQTAPIKSLNLWLTELMVQVI